jgi:hypothetical protein
MKSAEVTASRKTSFEDALAIAKKGTHCGMCRIDFLSTGLCPSGKKHGYLDYWPQGVDVKLRVYMIAPPPVLLRNKIWMGCYHM